MVNQNGSATAAAGAGGKPAAASEPHDWDAIFASFDEPAPGASSGGDAGNPPAASAAENKRPSTGRAGTEDGTHDDPILKNLTGMGYTRADALSALEKYDYNLERVSVPPPPPRPGLA